jgi:hypothetical protein
MNNYTESYYIVGIIFSYYGIKYHRFYHSFERDESYNGYSIKPQLHEFFADPIEANRYYTKTEAVRALNSFIPRAFESNKHSFPKKIKPKDFKVFSLSINLVAVDEGDNII